VISVLPYALHIVLASVAGGLPAVLSIMFATTGKRSHEEVDRFDIQTLKRFSAIALPVMVAVVATGTIVANDMVDTSYAALAATSWGWFLNTKLALLAVILVLAACARHIWIRHSTRTRKWLQRRTWT
jgi:putative copper resistance protein D